VSHREDLIREKTFPEHKDEIARRVYYTLTQDRGLIQQRTAAAVGHLVERLCHSGQMAASELDALLVEIVNT